MPVLLSHIVAKEVQWNPWSQEKIHNTNRVVCSDPHKTKWTPLLPVKLSLSRLPVLTRQLAD